MVSTRNFASIFLFWSAISAVLLAGEQKPTSFARDIELSQKCALISGMPREKVLNQNLAALTFCTTALSRRIWGIKTSFYHAYLSCEFADPLDPKKIKLLGIHFGGDGHSYIHNSGWPIIDDAKEVLAKIYRGKKNPSKDKVMLVEPIYKRHIVFEVKRELFLSMLAGIESAIEKEEEIRYSLKGFSWLGSKGVHNCCTFIDKILRTVGIDVGLKCFPIKNAKNFIECCGAYIAQKTRYERGEHYEAKKLYYFEPSDILLPKEFKQNLFEEHVFLYNENKIKDSLYALEGAALLGHRVAHELLASQEIRDKILATDKPLPIPKKNNVARQERQKDLVPSAVQKLYDGRCSLARYNFAPTILIFFGCLDVPLYDSGWLKMMSVWTSFGGEMP